MTERNKPRPEDWKKLQGGEPREVRRSDQVTDVVHDYEGGSGRIVPTHNDQKGQTIRQRRQDGSLVEFPAYKVDQLHGAPCDQRTKDAGGKGYTRATREGDKNADRKTTKKKRHKS